MHVGQGVARVVVIVVLVASGQDLGDAADDLTGENCDIVVRGWVEPTKTRPTGLVHGEHAIGQESVEMDIQIDEAAKALHEGDGAASSVDDALGAGSAPLPCEYDL